MENYPATPENNKKSAMLSDFLPPPVKYFYFWSKLSLPPQPLQPPPLLGIFFYNWLQIHCCSLPRQVNSPNNVFGVTIKRVFFMACSSKMLLNR